MYALKKFNASNAWLILDNATIHKIAQFHSLAEVLPVCIVYNAISTPQFNLAEYLFEYLKRDLRQCFKMSPYAIIQSMIRRAKNFDKRHSKQAQKRQLKAFVQHIRSGICHLLHDAKR